VARELESGLGSPPPNPFGGMQQARRAGLNAGGSEAHVQEFGEAVP
jgi:hypothetical protein